MFETLKLILIIVTTSVGAIGSVVQFRDQSGRIRLAGITILSTIVLAGIGAAVLEHLEQQNQNKQTMEIIEQNNAIMEDVKRTVFPLAGLSLEYSMSIDWNSQKIEPLLAYISKPMPEMDMKLPDWMGGHEITIGGSPLSLIHI